MPLFRYRTSVTGPGGSKTFGYTVVAATQEAADKEANAVMGQIALMCGALRRTWEWTDYAIAAGALLLVAFAIVVLA